MSTAAKVMVWQAEWDPRAPIARASISEGVNRQRQEKRGVQSLTGSLAQNLRFPGHISWSTFGKPMLNVVPDRGADAVWASEAPRQVAGVSRFD